MHELSAFLKKHPCSCGGRRKLTGGAFYSNPLAYIFRCDRCGQEGTVGYTTLREDKIELRENN